MGLIILLVLTRARIGEVEVVLVLIRLVLGLIRIKKEDIVVLVSTKGE